MPGFAPDAYKADKIAQTVEAWSLEILTVIELHLKRHSQQEKIHIRRTEFGHNNKEIAETCDRWRQGHLTPTSSFVIS